MIRWLTPSPNAHRKQSRFTCIDSVPVDKEVSPRDFSGFSGSHIHIPADVRMILSPEYELWFWICL
jgi:hypothetical protein